MTHRRGKPVFSRFLLFVGTEIAEDLVFRTRAKFRFITGIRPRESTNTMFTSVYGVHYSSGSLSLSLSNCLYRQTSYLFRFNYDIILLIQCDYYQNKNEKNLM